MNNYKRSTIHVGRYIGVPFFSPLMVNIPLIRPAISLGGGGIGTRNIRSTKNVVILVVTSPFEGALAQNMGNLPRSPNNQIFNHFPCAPPKFNIAPEKWWLEDDP